MKPVVGRITYREVTPEELTRALHQAEMLRAEAVRDSFFAIGHDIAFLARAVSRRVRHAVDGMTHPKAAGAR